MSNISRNNHNFWIASIVSALVFVLILEQRNMRQQLSDIEHSVNYKNQKILNSLAILPDKIINIGYAKFYVPNYPIDHVQSEIVDNNNFYEIDLLEKLQPYIKKNAVILDIGANIGNHSVYWAVRSDAKKIYSFEPVEDFFKILKRNVEINQVNNKVKIFNVGLSDQKINGSISHYDPTNIGGTAIKQDLNGNLALDKLDNIKIEEDTIDFVKIDVEGHEFQVLQGAEKTLKKYKPTIFIEIFPENKQKVHKFLTDLGYRLEKSFIGANYLYVFDEKN